MNSRTKISFIFTISVAILVFSACSAFKPATKEQYSKDGLTFTHFSNWEITEDSTTAEEGIEARIITVEGPHNAIFTASRFPPVLDMTIEEYVSLMTKEMKNSTKDITGGIEIVSMDDGKTVPSDALIFGVMRHGLAREFEVKALGTPVLHRAEYYLIENDKEKWFVTIQSSKEDWDSVKEGFQTILDSFPVSETKQQNAGAGKSK